MCVCSLSVELVVIERTIVIVESVAMTMESICVVSLWAVSFVLLSCRFCAYNANNNDSIFGQNFEGKIMSGHSVKMVNMAEIFSTEFIRLTKNYRNTNRVCIALYNPVQWVHANETTIAANLHSPPPPYFEQIVSSKKTQG